MDNKKDNKYYADKIVADIVHEYGNVDMSVIYDTVKNDIPELLKELKQITV